MCLVCCPRFSIVRPEWREGSSLCPRPAEGAGQQCRRSSNRRWRARAGLRRVWESLRARQRVEIAQRESQTQQWARDRQSARRDVILLLRRVKMFSRFCGEPWQAS